MPEITPQQWARAEALKALYANTQRPPMNMKTIESQIRILADLILTGELPPPPPGTCY
jgi:hypothetical protein